MARLKDTYKQEIVPAMMKKFNYKNIMQVPKLEKVVINMGMGDIKDNPKLLDSALEELATISGQAPVVTYARKSVANFKVREFVDKLVSIAIPRVRDFRGLSAKSFDGRGNYAMGFKEQLVFPEIDFDKVEKVRGMDIIIVTTANTDEEARELLTLMGWPFER